VFFFLALRNYNSLDICDRRTLRAWEVGADADERLRDDFKVVRGIEMKIN
jgi:hypothetical protein